MTDTPPPQQRQYPYQDGDVTVLGPEIFTSKDGAVISWRGDNYVRHEQVQEPHDLLPGALHELASATRDLASAIRLEHTDKTVALSVTAQQTPEEIGQQIGRSIRKERRRGSDGGS